MIQFSVIGDSIPVSRSTINVVETLASPQVEKIKIGRIIKYHQNKSLNRIVGQELKTYQLLSPKKNASHNPYLDSKNKLSVNLLKERAVLWP